MIFETAPAKVNLALHVRRRRADGYHEIETLFAFCADGDTVSLTPADTGSLTITGPFSAGLSTGDDNLVQRAATAFAGAFGVDQSFAIRLDKHLPVASGIGGGSADAAATLHALARWRGIDRDAPQLVAIAAALGADVPACLSGRTALGTGRGDDLRMLKGLSGTPILLVNPRVGVSTAAVFGGWDGVDRGAIGDGDLLAMARGGRNDLEPPARAVAPVIGAVRELLDAAPGMILSRMSGSGATCFALFDSAADRARAARTAAVQGWWCLESTLS
ncbi:4-diphosphocytidyl-2C-methyl-D-erythritol kinase [Sphingomonas sp. Leaf17]|uniref:4-(cytidine 5'-diphospho)-2-C-methyl-D-erythritol kinase n=1 Tax=Sphingomonas sp. Leaf17 TaxID=1735683 RepID=UPI0006F8BDD1|nr:4-(cytidine 5'-diphospho)-2-C-methyl-D-erythritol kinase [Sphingomonas sp. Leaf17]KQM65742.1 4-diphosphocytidyl-2C-methyl-D-erythritol kinase [Sphingomonas sp. Leaf17]